MILAWLNGREAAEIGTALADRFCAEVGLRRHAAFTAWQRRRVDGATAGPCRQRCAPDEPQFLQEGETRELLQMAVDGERRCERRRRSHSDVGSASFTEPSHNRGRPDIDGRPGQSLRQAQGPQLFVRGNKSLANKEPMPKPPHL